MVQNQNHIPPPIPIPIITRQKIMTPTISIARELEDKDWARVAKMMIMSSSPYILLRPTMSARAPNPNYFMLVCVCSTSSAPKESSFKRQHAAYLSNDSSSRSGDLDGSIAIGWHCSLGFWPAIVSLFLWQHTIDI